MKENAYQTLRNWYLATLRKSALTSAGEMTPSILMAADKESIERLIQDRSQHKEQVESSGLPASALKFRLGGFGLVDLKEANSFIDELNSSVEEISEKENAIADFALDLIFSIDAEKKIQALNPAAYLQLEYTNERLAGEPLSKILLADDRDKLEIALEEASSGSQAIQTVLRLLTFSGDLKDYLWTIEWSESNAVFFCKARDISAEKQLERVKEEFIAMVSHDLRAPLMSIQLTLSSLNKLQPQNFAPDLKEQIIAAERNSISLIGLINDLLDIEKMESGRLQLDMVDTMIQDLFENTSAKLGAVAREKSIKIEFETSELEFLADRGRLEQVLVNLLSNAIKFSEAGSSVKLLAALQGRMLEVKVVDSGPGIPQEHSKRIFDRFQQVRKSDSERGSGLGLAICKLIIESHAGTIGVRPAENGKGSEFWFKIPYRRTAG